MSSESVDNTILTRCTVHDYSAQPLPEGALERALSAALAAPNHRLTEPWRFVLIGPETRRQLARLSAELKAKKAGGAVSAELAQGLIDSFMQPPVLLALVQTVDRDANVERENYAALACAVQNATLSLWAAGIGSKWTTGAVTTAATTYRLLGVNESEAKIVGFLWVGFPAAPPRKPRRRLGLTDVLRHVP